MQKNDRFLVRSPVSAGCKPRAWVSNISCRKLNTSPLVSTFNRVPYVFSRTLKFEHCVTWHSGVSSWIYFWNNRSAVMFAFGISRVSSRFMSLIIIAMFSLRTSCSKVDDTRREKDSPPRRLTVGACKISNGGSWGKKKKPRIRQW